MAEGAGDLDGAARAYRRAAELARRGRIAPETACAEILLGRTLATAGRGDEARARLRGARACSIALGSRERLSTL